MPGKIINQFFVATRLDGVWAGLSHHARLQLFKKLIPAPDYYQGQFRSIWRYGVRFRVRPADVSQWTMFSDSDDQHVHTALDVLNKPGEGVVVDVGANIGQFSLLLAKQLSRMCSQRQIICFEPNPIIFNLLRKNLRLNNDLLNYVHLYQLGLGASDEYMEMPASRRNSSANFSPRYNYEKSQAFMIAVKTLDNMIRKPVDLIRINAKGMEFSVIRGARDILQQYHPALLMEIHPRHPHLPEMLLHLQQLGYSFYLVHGKHSQQVTPEQLCSLPVPGYLLARVV